MLWTVIWNLVLILSLVEWFVYKKLKSLHTSEESYSWLLFYLIYFGVWFFHSFLPIYAPWNWHTLSLQETFERIRWNPFLEWQAEWNQVRRTLLSKEVTLLVQFFLRHFGNLLVFLPMMDFIHAATENVYRHCLLFVLLIAGAVECVQFVLLWITGMNHFIPSFADVCTAGFGAACLGIIYWILDKRAALMPEEED